jgi:hypothetical protein
MFFRTLHYGVRLGSAVPSTSSTHLGRTIEEMYGEHVKLKELKK